MLHQSDPMSKADSVLAHWARAPCLKKFLVCFVNFYCVTRIFFYYSQHTMFTICFILYANYINIGCEGASKQSPDPKDSTAPGPRPRF